MHTIPFNKPYITGQEQRYIAEVTASRRLSGEGTFTRKCTAFFEQQYGIKKAFLTTSCTDALEMAAILLNIQAGDEVIAPAYTFVSTVNAFVLRGARIVFADSNAISPNIDAEGLEALITPRTKAIVAMHYAGIACDMDRIMTIAAKHRIFVVEDAAQSIDSYYKGRPLGTIGHLAAFSFHETKNVISGEGGLLAINDERFLQRAEIISEKGTNRQAFVRGEVNKYEWVDIGSSFMPSEITAAFLYAQLEQLRPIQQRRLLLWNTYFSALQEAEDRGYLKRPQIPADAAHNGHIFYVVLSNPEQRQPLIHFLKDKGISSAFHFLSLNKSRFYGKNNQSDLTWSDHYTDCLLRFPMYHELSTEEISYICEQVRLFFNKSSNRSV